jgi:hypothetical protein
MSVQALRFGLRRRLVQALAHLSISVLGTLKYIIADEADKVRDGRMTRPLQLGSECSADHH